MQRVLITGAGRGIGLELARQYAARGDRVLAGCRAIERAPGLRALVDQHRERVSILPLEVTDAGALAAAVQQTHQEVEGLDLLINNAACCCPRRAVRRTRPARAGPGAASRESPNA